MGRRSERPCVRKGEFRVSVAAARSLLRGFGRLRALATVLLLDDAGRFAAQAAQVIELGAPYLAAPHDLDRIDQRRIERKDALDALAVGNLAHREVLVEARSGAADAHALIVLDAAAFALHHLDVDQDGVAGLERRNGFAELGYLLLLELFDQGHGCLPRLRRRCGAHVGVSSSAGEVMGRRSFYDKERVLSPFRAGPFGALRRFGAGATGARRMGRPKVRTPLAGEALGLRLP